jgi:hypothetical protein
LADLQENKKPTSGLEPLTCSLRVIGYVLQGLAHECKSRISKPVSIPRVAVLHRTALPVVSEWYQYRSRI